MIYNYFRTTDNKKNVKLIQWNWWKNKKYLVEVLFYLNANYKEKYYRIYYIRGKFLSWLGADMIENITDESDSVIKICGKLDKSNT